MGSHHEVAASQRSEPGSRDGIGCRCGFNPLSVASATRVTIQPKRRSAFFDAQAIQLWLIDKNSHLHKTLCRRPSAPKP